MLSGTEDVGNESLSIAGKSRFGMIELKYTEEQLQFILEKALDLEMHDMKDAIKDYLMQIFKMTVELVSDRQIKYQAGIRHLTRIHKGFIDSIKLRSETMTLDFYEPTTGTSEEMEEVDHFGEYPLDFNDQVKETIDDVVDAYLLKAIVDENSPAYKDAVDAKWKGMLETGTFIDLVIEIASHELNGGN